jgi:hypothetical protein
MTTEGDDAARLERTRLIARALDKAADDLSGACCVNCGHVKRLPGKIVCASKDGPRRNETVQPADSCAAFEDRDQVAFDKRLHLTAGDAALADGYAVAIASRDDSLARAADADRLEATAAAGVVTPGKKKAKKPAPVRRLFLKPLPENCPVRPLGRMNRTYYYLDALNQLEGLEDKEHARLPLAGLFGGNVDLLTAWIPAVNKDGVVTGPQYESVGASLMKACSDRGLWDKRDRVRGRGCWSGEDGLVLHLGNRVVAGDKVHQPGELDRYVYPAAAAIMRPDEDAKHPGLDMLELFQRWNWARPHLDPLLLVGFCGAAVLGASLHWRPMVFVTGGAGRGKSTLNKAIELLLGGWLVWSNDATPAGITSTLGLDCLPVAVDENEARPDDNRARQMVELARLAASGGTKRRGSSNHEAHEFTLRSAMLFSAINPPAMEEQDRSRFAILKLDRLDGEARSLDLEPQRLKELGGRLLARLMADADMFQPRFRRVSDALRKAGHSQRGQDVFGTLLTVAWTLIGEADCDVMALPLASRVHELAALMNVDEMAETAGREDNWERCLRFLMTAPVEALRTTKTQTIGAVLDALDEHLKPGAAPEDGISPGTAGNLIKQAGMKLLDPDGRGAPFRLFIPHSSEVLARVFRGSPWAGISGKGGWSDALEQAPKDLWDRRRERLNGHARGLSFAVSTLTGAVEATPDNAPATKEQVW